MNPERESEARPPHGGGAHDGGEPRDSGKFAAHTKNVSESMDFEELESVMWRKVLYHCISAYHKNADPNRKPHYLAILQQLASNYAYIYVI